MRVKRLFIAALAALPLLVVAGPSGPVEAAVLNEFTVVNLVAGTDLPDSGTFEVTVTCTSPEPPPDGGDTVTTLTFDHTGAPLGSNVVAVPLSATCSATETTTNGAHTVGYACETAGPVGAPEGEVEVVCRDDRSVVFSFVNGATGTVTITNTFQAQEPPPPPPPPTTVPDPDVSPDEAEADTGTEVSGAVVSATPTFAG